jgi:hypothetical protein
VVGLVLALGQFAITTETARAEPTNCSADYDHSVQWTATTSVFYHPETGCFGTNAYRGWVGINGQVQSPSHFPNINNDTSNHSLGWIEMMFSNPSGWIQVGWLAGCLINGTTYTCSDPSGPLKIYDESENLAFNPPLVVVATDGTFNYSTGDIFRVEYYPQYPCWDIFDSYNNLIRSFCGTFPWQSGAPAVAGEVCNCDAPPYVEIEMPTTVFGYSNPNTNNALRVKGANGYVPWNGNLSSYTTSWYDERTCPNSSCPSPSVPYYISNVTSNYQLQTYGNTS